MILSKAKAFGELGSKNSNVDNNFMFEEQKSIMIDEEDMMAASEIYDSQQFLNLMKETAPPKQELQPI